MKYLYNLLSIPILLVGLCIAIIALVVTFVVSLVNLELGDKIASRVNNTTSRIVRKIKAKCQ